jgi:CheY-like chemotaxis protein
VLDDELRETIKALVVDKEQEMTCRAQPGVAEDVADRMAVSSVPLRVVVAEDNEFNSQLMSGLLSKRGHDVRIARTGTETLRLLELGEYDLLLLDVHMPELDGFQVIHAIRRQEQATGRRLPVIAVTARSRKEDRDRCLDAGMDDYLAKPINAASLWTAIDRLLTSASAES